MEGRIAELEERMGSLEKDLIALRGKVAGMAEVLGTTREELAEVREMLGALLNSPEGPGSRN